MRSRIYAVAIGKFVSCRSMWRPLLNACMVERQCEKGFTVHRQIKTVYSGAVFQSKRKSFRQTDH